ncbi:MAG: AMP-binding protein, partial [Blastocatellia bacterium]
APKGVAGTHRVATNLIRWNLSVLDPGRNTLQFASLSFDVAFQEVFSTWTSGGTLVLISDEDRRDAVALSRIVRERQVERLFLPAVVLQQFAGQVLLEEPAAGAVPEVITAGEQVKVSHQVRRLFNGQNGRILHNHYGPSETHVATAFRLGEQPDSWPDLPPIGEPIPNANVYLLNENLEVAPAGTQGEMFIGGDILARGYLKHPDLTAQKFLCDPFHADGSRLYRSGDMGRLRADGQIEFLGRLDNQVKVRGFRVELGEIESTLGSNPAITQAVVSAFGDGSGGNRLVAFVVPFSLDHIDARVLTEFLRDRLPDYMIPSEFVLLEKLPVTATGKVDRRALSTQ